ncbi:MAG TPA: carboxymuconolactone decarboxylase family protein [Acidimicrobiales bacterium]|nr:carboxymuconolactone decarboxylase family protein [Acidimicrobiales bacterium]
MARIDLPTGDEPEVVRALALRPELANAVTTYDQAVWNSRLDWRLHELVRMRVAQINQCTVCLSWRTPQAVDAGVTEDLLLGVQWASKDPAYTPAEKVAIEYAERYCTDSAAIQDELIDRLRRHFDDGEIVELTLVIAKYLAFGRFMQVLGLDQTCSLEFDATGTVVATHP